MKIEIPREQHKQQTDEYGRFVLKGFKNGVGAKQRQSAGKRKVGQSKYKTS